jgi:hypothetical protein
MTISCGEPKKELVNMELLSFMHYHVNIKESKCFFQQWEKHESLFPTIRFLGQHILRIP